MEHLLKKTRLSLLLPVILVAGCLTPGHNQQPLSYITDVRSSVSLCAKGLRAQTQELIPSFLAVDAVGLDYYIILADQDVANGQANVRFCHVDKESTEVVFLNGREQLLKEQKGSKEYSSRYDDIYSGKVLIKQARISRYKLINGVWRYIEERTVTGS